MDKKELIIFTNGFPYGDSEISFLSTEIKILASRFKNIILLPIHPDRLKSKQSLPENVKVIDLKESVKSNPNRTGSDYFFIVRMFLSEFLSSRNSKLLKNFKYHISELFVYLDMAKKINTLEQEGSINKENSIYYSYWFDAGASAMSLFKTRYRKDVRFISRAHGFDLYEERSEKGYIFPRHLQAKCIDKVYTISENGKHYLIDHFPILKTKTECSRLGTVLPENFIDVEGNSNTTIFIVSCSSLIPLKRVHKIIEILMFCKTPIRWVHFGDGILRKELELLCSSLPQNIEVDFKGNADNTSILKFYAENKINWFINVSETEGIPVSIMEAISFGIPAIATNVGGTKEIVNNTTGILIEKNFSAEAVAKLIEEKKYSTEERKNIHLFWNENYNAIKNFSAFAEKNIGIEKNYIVNESHRSSGSF